MAMAMFKNSDWCICAPLACVHSHTCTGIPIPCMFLKFLLLNAHFARYQQSSLCKRQLFCKEGCKYVCAQQCCVVFGAMPACARMEVQQRAVRFPSKQGKSMCYFLFADRPQCSVACMSMSVEKMKSTSTKTLVHHVYKHSKDVMCAEASLHAKERQDLCSQAYCSSWRSCGRRGVQLAAFCSCASFGG